MFQTCTKLKRIDISSFTSQSLITNSDMFWGCSDLETLIIDNPNLFVMTNPGIFYGTKIESGSGYIYVPDNMVSTYKSATNWNEYANQIKGMSELPQGV